MTYIIPAGFTKDTWLSTIHEEVAIGEYPFGHILMWGEDFKLEGQELEDFIRDSIVGLLKAGTVPITIERKDGMLRFVMNKNYGTEPQEIVDNIMAEWRKKGKANYTDKHYPFTGPWFGEPDGIWQKVSPPYDPEASSD